MPTEMAKFGEFIKTLSAPASLHLFKMEPLRGSAIFVIDSKLIFTLVDIVFGGSGKEPFRIEGRGFTAIEINLVKRLVIAALADFEKAFKTLIDLKVVYQRSETNPSFAQIATPTDVAVLLNFEIELTSTSGLLSLCIPYALLEPVRDKLREGFGGEQPEVDKMWLKSFREGLLDSWIDLVVELGRTHVSVRDVVSLKKGDVIQLDLFASDPLKILVEGVVKFTGYPGVYKGNQAVRIAQVVPRKGRVDYGTE
jgi:flagellar motor switch protein FliM